MCLDEPYLFFWRLHPVEEAAIRKYFSICSVSVESLNCACYGTLLYSHRSKFRANLKFPVIAEFRHSIHFSFEVLCSVMLRIISKPAFIICCPMTALIYPIVCKFYVDSPFYLVEISYWIRYRMGSFP
jgi:hypothetical protein